MYLSPLSNIVASPYSTQITTANVITPLTPYTTFNSPTGVSLYSPVVPYGITYSTVPLFDVNTGLNESWLAQKDMTHDLLMRILDKWLYTDELCHVLKYLKIVNGKVQRISNSSEIKANKVCDDSNEDIEKKADYIEANLLTTNDMRHLLQRICDETGTKWFELRQKEDLVLNVVDRYLRKKLKNPVEKEVSRSRTRY